MGHPVSDVEKPIVKIKLISAEDKEFNVDVNIIEHSQFIARKLENTKIEPAGGKIIIKLPNIETKVLQKIIHWCMQHSNITDENEIEIFEKNFLRENDYLIRKLFIASLSLEIIRLLEQTSQIISEKIQKEIEKPKEDANYVNKNGHFHCTDGFILKNRYKIFGKIGKGTYGSVFKALDLENKTWVAIKIIKDSKGFKPQGGVLLFY